jgi:two-component system chemotaxis sensor kinase CheA
VCRDDGRGIDVDAVRTAAVARGLIEAGAARSLTADEVVALLGTGGLTTSASLTELSGRGIGMDVVRATTARLKGAHAVSSEPRQGTSIELHVPISIASMQSLLVEVDGAAVAIPLDAVRLTLRVKDEDIAYTANRRSILIGDEVIPFLPLERAIGRAGRPTRRCRRAWSAVVVKADSRCVAVGVDRLTGTANIIMRPLSRVVEADPVIAGVSLDADGNPQLVVDPSGLVAVADRDLDRERDEAAPLRAPILIVDDSLTTRMLEQSILESAGYEVELAVCAEEGLAKARTRRYGLFVVDVEMPGMDGFGFVAEIRADAALRDTPAILVTSRDSNEDRRRGDEVGARAYIVKGEFDQGNLLRTIRRLTG